MRVLPLAMTLMPIVCLAGQAVQTDWSGGPGAQGPVSDWGDLFDSADSVSWLSIEGQLALASKLLEEPVSHQISPSFGGSYTADVGDIDGDGNNDVLGGGYSANSYCVWFSDGAGGWSRETVTDQVDGPCGCDLADIDADGDLDVLCATYRGGRLLVYYNQGGSSPEWEEQVLSSALAGGHDVESFDLDLDGDLDVVAASAEGDSVSWWRNDGGFPVNWVERTVDRDFDYACRIDVEDVNGDGNPDIIGAAWEGHEICAWYGTGGPEPSWTRQTLGPARGAHALRACDVDSDGDVDVLASAMTAGDLVLFVNDGADPPGWTKQYIDMAFNACGYVRDGDIDGDGDPDAVTCSFGTGGLAWYENDGTATVWTKHQVASGLGTMALSMPADLDTDGDLDILVTGYSGSMLGWFEMSEFVGSGSIDGTVLDTGCSPQWASIEWDASVPTSANCTVQYRSSNDPDNLGPWSEELSAPSSISGSLERYFQYRVNMSSGSADVCPVFEELRLDWDPLSVEEGGSGSGFHLSLRGSNPVRGEIEIEACSDSPGSAELLLFDLTGREVWSCRPSLHAGTPSLFRMEVLSPGVYRALLRDAKGRMDVIAITVL